MYYLYAVTIVALFFSFFRSREKTKKAVKIAFKKFTTILPAFLIMLILVSIVLFLLPDRVISEYLAGDNKLIGLFFASIIGSVVFMPGFISFPLCGILLTKGVSYMVLSAFSTTLMMVGVLSFPVEKEYFGVRVTVIRNAIGFLMALVVAVMTGIFFGEIF